MIRLKGLPLVRFGVDLENKDLSGGFRIYRNNLNMQIQQYFRVGTPSVIVRYEDRTNPRYWIQEKVREVRLGFLSFIKRSRIRLEHQMIRYDEGLWGSVAHVETDVNILGQTIGFYLSTGKVWKRDYEGGFEETPVTSAGIRSNFMVRPFGKNYTMRLEVGRVMSELEDYQRSWRIALSLSAGTVPRFYVPVPFVKTKGRVEGVLFVDKNQNKIRDPDEQGLSHAVFLLKGESVITDSDGRFQSAPLEPGEYSFFLDMASLPAYVSPAGLIPANLSIHRGSIISLQIPLTSVCSFSGVLFLDLNRNERMDEDETPLGRVRLLVQNEQNQTWEVYTDLKGQFLASDLLPGTYRVKVDSSWLPDRTRVHRDETLVVLTPQQPHVETAIPVVKEQLEIRKTFIAPKKNP
jgi:hypothetical protein